MPGMVKDLTKATRDGGNNAVIVQLLISSTGTYIDATAVDVLGAAAKTGHYLGNFVDSGAARQPDGAYKFTFTIMEQDLQRANMLELLSPITANDTSADQLIMEDNVSFVGSKAVSFDPGKPVFAIWYFYKDLAGKHMCRHAIGQFAPDGGYAGAKAKQWNQFKCTFNSIDAIGSPAVSQPADALFTVTTPALASPYQFGKVLQGT